MNRHRGEASEGLPCTEVFGPSRTVIGHISDKAWHEEIHRHKHYRPFSKRNTRV